MLRYTIKAVRQCARNGVNAELVETTIVFPATSGVMRGGPVAWFSREFGNRRITVWATGARGDREPVVTNMEVTAINRPK
jgi:hypothetical protein